jgi:hypothetical protein
VFRLSWVLPASVEKESRPRAHVARSFTSNVVQR